MWGFLLTNMSKRVFVLGMGSSGLAAAKKLQEMGNDVFVSDAAPRHHVQSAVQNLTELNISFETGGHSESIASGCQMIVKSPGIPPDIPFLQRMRQKGIPVYSEIEAGYWYARAPIIGITGTNGKSTTTSLVGELLKQKYKNVFTGGNLGPPFTACPNMAEKDVFVLEVSSYQLENIHQFKPHVAVLLNIAPDHLDRHRTMKRYIAAKKRLLENQTAFDVVFYNSDDSLVSEMIKNTAAQKIPFTLQNTHASPLHIRGGKLYKLQQQIANFKELKLQGEHNHSNILAAVLCAMHFDVSIESIRQVLTSFQPLEHRIEYVGELNGVQFYNDSKATNSASTIAALKRFQKPVLLLAGGMAKEAGFDHMQPLVEKKVKKAFLFGTSRDTIVSGLTSRTEYQCFDTMKKALSEASKSALPGDIILLSPMCASHDQFDNYIQRGKIFKQLVQAYIQKGKTG